MRRSSFWICGPVENIHCSPFVSKCRLGLISAVCDTTRKEQIRSLISLLHNLHQKDFASSRRTLIYLASFFRLIRCFWWRILTVHCGMIDLKTLKILTPKARFLAFSQWERPSYKTCCITSSILALLRVTARRLYHEMKRFKTSWHNVNFFYTHALQQREPPSWGEDINNYYWNNIPSI